MQASTSELLHPLQLLQLLLLLQDHHHQLLLLLLRLLQRRLPSRKEHQNSNWKETNGCANSKMITTLWLLKKLSQNTQYIFTRTITALLMLKETKSTVFVLIVATSVVLFSTMLLLLLKLSTATALKSNAKEKFHHLLLTNAPAFKSSSPKTVLILKSSLPNLIKSIF